MAFLPAHKVLAPIKSTTDNQDIPDANVKPVAKKLNSKTVVPTKLNCGSNALEMTSPNNPPAEK